MNISRYVYMALIGGSIALASCGRLKKDDQCNAAGQERVQSEDTRVFKCRMGYGFERSKKVYLPGSCTKPGYKFHTSGMLYACLNEQGDMHFEDDDVRMLCPTLNKWVKVEKSVAVRGVYIFCDNVVPTASRVTWTFLDKAASADEKTWAINDFFTQKLLSDVGDDKIQVCWTGRYQASQDQSSVQCASSPRTTPLQPPF